jgi:hypothetical protein
MVGIAWERDRVVRVVETAAVVALCVLAVGGNAAGVEGLWRRVLGVALGAAMTVPLLARRRAPLAVATADDASLHQMQRTCVTAGETACHRPLPSHPTPT